MKTDYQKNKLFELVLFFNKVLDRKFKLSLLFIIGVSILNSFVEILGFAALIPFLTFLNDDSIYSNSNFLAIKDFLEITNPDTLILFFVLSALVFFFASILISYLINYLIFKFSYKFNTEFGKKLILSYLKDNPNLIDQNTISEMINKITHETSKLCEMLSSLIQFFSKLIFILIIFIILSSYKFKLLLVISVIIIFYFIVFRYLKKYIIKLANQLSVSQNKIINLSSNIVEAFKEIHSLGIKDKIYNEYNFYKERYEKIFFLNTLFTTFPKVLIELIVISIIFIFTFLIYSNYNLDVYRSYFFEISILFVAFVRFNPLANIIYTNYQVINKFSNVIKIFSKDIKGKINIKTINSLKDSKHHEAKINKIIIKNLNFKYRNSKNKILSNINLTFEKGKMYGIIGESGSGKSTFVNIISNFLRSKETLNKIFYIDNLGKKIDKNLLTNKILLLSQKTFLFNTSLRENITLKRNNESIDDKKFLKVIKSANIEKFRGLQKKKFKGEIYYNFSGGEIQRIAIARAFYQEKDLIIFDESLSNLNQKKQYKIINEIKKLKKEKIIIMIFHDIHLMKYFDKVYNISKGKLSKIKNF